MSETAASAAQSEPAEPNVTEGNSLPETPEPAKSTMKMPSLNDITTQLKQSDEEKNNVQEEEKRESKPVTFDQILALWNEYTEARDKEGKINQTIILKNCEPSMEGTMINITLDNPLQEEQLNSFKEDLMTFLREKSENYELMISSVVKEPDETKMIYTAAEKYRHLAKKHPSLDKMKDAFGLDTDH